MNVYIWGELRDTLTYDDAAGVSLAAVLARRLGPEHAPADWLAA